MTTTKAVDEALLFVGPAALFHLMPPLPARQ
jgi:hypothetical protein